MSLAPLKDAKLRPNGTMLPPYPHMRPKECEFIESHLNPDTIMLEWGSGYSTLRFSQQVSKYYSIEHDPNWYKEIKPQLGQNVDYRLVNGVILPGPEERKAPAYNPDRWHRPAASWDKIGGSLRDKQYHDYIRAIHTIKEQLDIIFIDGRARCECAKAALEHATSDTTIFFHNWDRPHYHIILKKYKLVKKVKTMALLRKK